MDGRINAGRFFARCLGPVLGLLLLGIFGMPTRAVADPGQISGYVRDASGQPIAGVTVLLEASRTAFRLRSFKRQTTEPVQLPTTTDTSGRFTFPWRQDRHFTDIELHVALPVKKGGRDAFERFLSQDISEQVRAAEGPLEVLLTVQDSTQLAWLRRFLDGTAHADEDKVFRDMGRPDRLDRDDVLDESSWWYFSAGKVYHFRAGKLDQVTHFDPVGGTRQ